MLLRLLALGLVATVAHFAAAPATQDLATSTPATSGTTYRVDPVHSSIVFRIKHLNVAHFYGRFNEISGTIQWSDDDPSASGFDIRISTASVDTANQARDNHLRSADFFLAEEHPALRFRTTKIERPEGTGEKYKATGELTLRGVTREITVDLEHTGSGNHPRTGRPLLGLHSIFAIRRTDFDMPYGVENGMLGDEVVLMIGIEGIAQE